MPDLGIRQNGADDGPPRPSRCVRPDTRIVLILNAYLIHSLLFLGVAMMELGATLAVGLLVWSGLRQRALMREVRESLEKQQSDGSPATTGTPAEAPKPPPATPAAKPEAKRETAAAAAPTAAPTPKPAPAAPEGRTKPEESAAAPATAPAETKQAPATKGSTARKGSGKSTASKSKATGTKSGGTRKKGTPPKA
ncbi:hypothetical protein [uncultured Rhodospira sp.]|uniref:hypothetical protein n=1 Tax=uncultured Rhodospira sp. TaxID=1936189 RepID=UPI0026347DB9|nr:hypothetical protein [uncultured Rhodospira sp.]